MTKEISVTNLERYMRHASVLPMAVRDAEHTPNHMMYSDLRSLENT